MDKRDREKSKFKKFYIYGTLLWLIFIVHIFYIFWTSEVDVKIDVSYSLLSSISLYGFFIIPVIFILSFFIRVAEYLINKFYKESKED